MTFFTSVTEADLERERKVERIVAENLARWQEEGLAPDMEIEPGNKTDEPIRTRGWTYWYHLFTPRDLFFFHNDEVKEKMGEPVFNDSDLQMAGYAAALKVLTAYTQIGGEDVTTFAMRPRQHGETTVVDEIVQQAAEAANSLLVPEQLSAGTWHKLNGIQRFYLRMMDMESTGASKLLATKAELTWVRHDLHGRSAEGLGNPRQ